MSIEDWRAEIDEIDDELLRLLNMRARLAIQVGESKRDAGLSLCDREREREVEGRVCRGNSGPLDSRAVRLIFRVIIRESKRLQEQTLKQPASRAEEVLR